MIKKLLKSIANSYSEHYAAKAFNEIRDQAERGNPSAQLALARMYESGEGAVTQDLVAAYFLYYLAAEKGIVEADNKLRSLELIMPAEQWREAKDHIRKRDEKMVRQY